MNVGVSAETPRAIAYGSPACGLASLNLILPEHAWVPLRFLRWAAVTAQMATAAMTRTSWRLR
jgi:hypothetical protein